MAGRGVQREDSPDETEGDTALTGTITLPGVDRSVARGRRFVRETLGSRHPALDKVALGVSELATNAIMHTPSGDGGEITIGLLARGTLIRVEVTNDGTMPAKPRVRRDADAESGRGILIVDALADAWGVTEASGTTTVWAEFHGASWTLPRPDLRRPRPPAAQNGTSPQNAANTPSLPKPPAVPSAASLPNPPWAPTAPSAPNGQSTPNGQSIPNGQNGQSKKNGHGAG